MCVGVGMVEREGEVKEGAPETAVLRPKRCYDYKSVCTS